MKRVLLLLGIVMSTASVFAAENVLQTIEIEPVKDTYNIVLVSDVFAIMLHLLSHLLSKFTILY